MDDNSRQDSTTAQAETQNSLRLASTALEAAYRRIRELRHSLLELADSMPPSDSQSAIPNPTNIAPAHEAILLSGTTSADEQADSLVHDMARLRSSLPPPVMERLEQFESEFLGDQQTDRSSEPPVLPPAPSGSTTRQLPPSRSSLFSINSPAVQHRNSLLPRRSLLESQLSRRRDVNPDDPSTALGRRVAAREAGEISADSSIPHLERFLLSTTAVVARNIENMTNRLNQRSQTIDPIAFTRTDTAPSHRQTGVDPRQRRGLEGTGSRGGRSPSVGTTQASAAASMFPPRPPATRRWRTLIRPESGGRQATSGPPSGQSTTSTRLSILSNFSAVDNFSSPVTPLSRERPILFDEPFSYAPPNQSGETPFEDDFDAVDRNYLVRRTVNADGDELVHNVNLLWNDPDEDRSAWIPPQQSHDNIAPRRSIPGPVRDIPFRNDIISDARSPRAPPEAPRRRRGWARLDADGNEISTDEEEELERIRAENRVRRSLYQSRAIAQSQLDHASDNATAPTSGQSLIQATRPPPEFDDSDRIQGRDPRTLALDSVLLLDRARRSAVSFSPGSNPSAASSGDTTVTDFPEMFGSPNPFVVDPLPMPLDVMVPVCDAVCKERVALGTVPKYASWAGR